MDKYGVDEPEKSAKNAEEGQTCPECGSPVLPDFEETGILRCPNCGSAPFEG